MDHPSATTNGKAKTPTNASSSSRAVDAASPKATPAHFPPIKKTKKGSPKKATRKSLHGKGVTLPKVSPVTFATSNDPVELDSGEELEVLKCILVREGYLQRLGRASAAGHISGAHLGETVDVLDLVRLATLETVDAIETWRKHKRERQLEEAKTSGPAVSAQALATQGPEPFKWNGIDYLLKMASDLEFLGKHAGLTQWLGFTLERNPFILPLNLDCRAKILAEQQREMQLDTAMAAPDSSRFLQVGGKRTHPSTRDGLRSANGNGNASTGASAAALAQALAERKRAKTPYETRVLNDEELVPTTPPKSESGRPKSRLPRGTGTSYSSVLPSQIGDVDMVRLHEAEIIVLQEEAVFGRYARDLQGRVVPEAEAQRRISMMELSGGAYPLAPMMDLPAHGGTNADSPRLVDSSHTKMPGKMFAKKRSGMLGPVTKPEWRSFERPPPPRPRSRGAQLEEALTAERQANTRLGVLIDSLREETERKAMDVAYFESCSELQTYGDELRTFTAQALRELAVLERELQEKRHMYESKRTNIHRKEELLSTFKVHHKSATDAFHAAQVEGKKKPTATVASLNQQQQRREDQEQAVSREAVAAEQRQHAQITPIVQHFCATLIQKIMRGMLAREEYAIRKIEYVVASTFIQAVARGFLVRRCVARLYLSSTASVHVQRMIRGWLARILVQTKRRRRLEERSAERIQKVTRGRFGRVRMGKLRKLVGWRRQLALAARNVTAVTLQELSTACQTMIALPRLTRAMTKSDKEDPPLPALVLGLVRLLMLFTSDADDEWDIPNTRWREAAWFLRCGVGLSRRIQKIADAAAGAAGGSDTCGMAVPTRRLRESPLGTALLDAYSGDRQFCAETFERLSRGWQAAGAIFQWVTAFAAITRLQVLLEPSTEDQEPALVVKRALSEREARHEATERREAQQEEEASTRRFVPEELTQAPGYPRHRPHPLLLVVANDIPPEARASIVDKLLLALPGLFLVLNRPSTERRRRQQGAVSTSRAFDFAAVAEAVALGHAVILEGDVGMRDVTQRAFLSSFATVKSAIHPPPLCVLLRGSAINRGDISERERTRTQQEVDERHRKEDERRGSMADADVKLALEHTTQLRLELADDAMTQQMIEQAKCGLGDLAPSPSAAFVVVMEAVIVLLTPAKLYDGPSQPTDGANATSAVSWRLARRLLARPAFLHAKLQQVNAATVPTGNRAALERYLRHPQWPSAAAARSQVSNSTLLLALASWVEAATQTARLVASDGLGVLAPEITRSCPVAGIFGRVVIFRNSATDGVESGAGEDDAVLELLDAVLADVLVHRTAHVLESDSNKCVKPNSQETKDEAERCVVSIFHECRRIFVSAYSPRMSRRWLTVLSEDDVDALLTPASMAMDGQASADGARAAKRPPTSHADVYGRIVRLTRLQVKRLGGDAATIVTGRAELETQPRERELVVRPLAVRLYRHVLQLGGFLATITVSELSRGHVQVDVFVHSSSQTRAQSVTLRLAVQLESVLGRMSAAQAQRVFVAAPRVAPLLLDRLHLFRLAQTQEPLPEPPPETSVLSPATSVLSPATSAASGLRLCVRTTERALGRVLLRRAVRVPSTNPAATSGERWVFTLTERHEYGDFQATFYAPRTSSQRALRLSASGAQELVRLSRHVQRSKLEMALQRSFRFAEPNAQAPTEEDQASDSDSNQQEAVELGEPAEGSTVSCCRTRRRVLARFPCALRVSENPHQLITKKLVVRLYVQAERCDEERLKERGDDVEGDVAASGSLNTAKLATATTSGGDALRFRMWLPECCAEQTLVLHESEVEASLPTGTSWCLAVTAERRRLSRELVRSFEWESASSESTSTRGCVVARLACGSFRAVQSTPAPAASWLRQRQQSQREAFRKIRQPGGQMVRGRRGSLHQQYDIPLATVVSCVYLLDEKEDSGDEEDEEIDEEDETHATRRNVYRYDVDEFVHRGSYRTNGLLVVLRVAMRAELRVEPQPTLKAPVDRVRERDSFSFKLFVYHPESSTSAVSEIRGRRELREVVGPDRPELIASSSMDALMRHIIQTRTHVRVDGGNLHVSFLRDRLYAKQKVTPATQRFGRDAAANAAKLIDESRHRGVRGVKVATRAKELSGCGRTLLTIFDVSESQPSKQTEPPSVLLRADAYVVATSARLSLLLEGSDLLHVVGDEDKELLVIDANGTGSDEENERRRTRLALLLLDHLRVEQRRDGRGDRLVLSDYCASSLAQPTALPIHTEAEASRMSKAERIFKTVRAVDHEQMLLSGYLVQEDDEELELRLRLELYDPSSSTRCSLVLARHTLAALLGLPEALVTHQVLTGGSTGSDASSHAATMTHICSFVRAEKTRSSRDEVQYSPPRLSLELLFDERSAAACVEDQLLSRGCKTTPGSESRPPLPSWTGMKQGIHGDYFSVHLQLLEGATSRLVATAFSPTRLLVGTKTFATTDMPTDLLTAAHQLVNPQENVETATIAAECETFFSSVCCQLQVRIDSSRAFHMDGDLPEKESAEHEGEVHKAAQTIELILG